MDAIVFTSNTGFTEKYARMLGKETGLPVYTLKKAQKDLAKGAEIIYLGWLSVGNVKGYKDAAKRYRIRALCAVGMMDPSPQANADLQKKNGLSCPAYVLQGGYAPDRLTGFDKLGMKMMSKFVLSELAKKPSLTPEEQAKVILFRDGADRVSAEQLKPLLTWLKTAK